MKQLKKKKRGLYFTMEAVIAMMILSVGFGIIGYMFGVLAKPPVSVVQTSLYDTVDLFNTDIASIGNGSCSAESPWTEDGNITDIEQSLLNQAGEFYYRYNERECDYCDELLQDCLKNFTTYRNIEQENLEIKIENQQWYINGTKTQENASVIFPYKVLLLGTQNGTTMWGPYVAEVKVWE